MLQIRVRGRTLFGALLQRSPERARVLLPRLDSSVQKQLAPVIAAYAAGVLSNAPPVILVCPETQISEPIRCQGRCRCRCYDQCALYNLVKHVIKAEARRSPGEQSFHLGCLCCRPTSIRGAAQCDGIASPGGAAGGSAAPSTPPPLAPRRRPSETRPRVERAHTHGSISRLRQARSRSSPRVLLWGDPAFPPRSQSVAAVLSPQLDSLHGRRHGLQPLPVRQRRHAAAPAAQEQPAVHRRRGSEGPAQKYEPWGKE